MMLGTSELLEEMLLVFSFSIFLLQRARAVAAGGRGDGGRRPGRAVGCGMLSGAWRGAVGRSSVPFWSLALPKTGLNISLVKRWGLQRASAAAVGCQMPVPGDLL